MLRLTRYWLLLSKTKQSAVLLQSFLQEMVGWQALCLQNSQPKTCFSFGREKVLVVAVGGKLYISKVKKFFVGEQSIWCLAPRASIFLTLFVKVFILWLVLPQIKYQSSKNSSQLRIVTRMEHGMIIPAAGSRPPRDQNTFVKEENDELCFGS